MPAAGAASRPAAFYIFIRFIRPQILIILYLNFFSYVAGICAKLILILYYNNNQKL